MSTSPREINLRYSASEPTAAAMTTQMNDWIVSMDCIVKPPISKAITLHGHCHTFAPAFAAISAGSRPMFVLDHTQMGYLTQSRSPAICELCDSNPLRKLADQSTRLRRKPVLPRQHVKLHVRGVHSQTIWKSSRQRLRKKLVLRSRDVQNRSLHPRVLVLFPILRNTSA